MAPFEGVCPALITPFDENGKLNEHALRQVIEFNIQAGVHGFWVAGGTGESVLLDDDENRRIAEIAVDQNQGRINNIMHVGAATTARAAALAEHAAKTGVEAICCVPPFFYSATDEAIVEHYRIVGAAADLPLFVYNLPSSTGVEITPALIRKIQDAVPQLTGLKHSGPAFTDVWDFHQLGLACFIGRCQLMLPAMTIGAVGCIDGPPNVAPELWVAIWDAYRAGDWSAAEEAQGKATAAGWALVNHGFPAAIKAGLSVRLGVDCGQPRPPQPGLDDATRQRLERTLADLGIGSKAID
ncbi:MAG: dihydrodipicolinate synthase family protein [Pseudomonadota bacterium]